MWIMFGSKGWRNSYEKNYVLGKVTIPTFNFVGFGLLC
jgi:hypothetical protein